MSRRLATLVFVFFSLFFVLTNSFRDSVQVPDEEYVLLVATNLVHGEPLHLPPEVPVYPGASDAGRDGKIYSAYQIGQSLVYAPFYWGIKALVGFSIPYDPARFGGTEEEYGVWLERKVRSYLYFCPSLLAGLACLLFFLFAVRLGYHQTTSLILTLFFGFGTMVWPYSKYLLTEATQNALLLWTVYLLFKQRQEGRLFARDMALAGAAFGLLLSIRVVFAPLLPFLAFYWFYGNREKRLTAPFLIFSLSMVALFIPQLIYDHHRFGSIFSLGYAGAKFSTPLFVGLYGFWLSPGKSFFLYNPISLLFFFGIWRFFSRAKPEALLFTLFLLVIPLKYAAWWVWSGDPGWGPRYLLVLAPYFLLPAGEVVEKVLLDQKLWRRGLIAVLFMASVGVQCLGVAVHYLHYLGYVQRHASLMNQGRYLAGYRVGDAPLNLRDRYLETSFFPEYSPILGQMWAIKTLAQGKETNPPWAGLGISEMHSDQPLEATWDLWVVDLVQHGLTLINIEAILGALALLIVLAIVGRELFVSTFWREPKESS